MSYFTTDTYTMKREIVNFSNKLSHDLPKPNKKFIADMTYGILASKSCLLSDITDTLHEDIKKKNTIERLSRHLANGTPDLLLDHYLTQIKKWIPDEPVIHIDDSDIVKPNGYKFESLGTVRDGSASTSSKNVFQKGYHVTEACAMTSNGHPVSIFSEIHSSKEKGFKSVNSITLSAIEKGAELFGKSTFVMDRGYDANRMFLTLDNLKQDYVIRLTKKRKLLLHNKWVTATELCNRRKGKIKSVFFYKGKDHVAYLSHIKVQVTASRKNVNFVLVYGITQHPMMLLTNKEIKGKDDVIKVRLFSVSKTYQILNLILITFNGVGVVLNYILRKLKKDAIMNLMGKTVVEIEEFVALRNAKSANEAKSFLSKLSDRIRIPYEKFSTDVPRTCILIGTLNERTFLNDHTGERRYLPVECHKENRRKAIYLDKNFQGEQSEKEYLDSIREDFNQALAYGYKLYKEKKHFWTIPKKLLEDLYQEQEKFKYLNPDVEDIRYFLEEYKAKTQEPNITCFKELSMQGYGIKSKSFSEIMDNYFPEWKAIRSSKTKRISPSGISIPVKLYYKKEEKIEESFVEVDKVDLPKEWQESEQIEMDTGENKKEKERL